MLPFVMLLLGLGVMLLLVRLFMGRSDESARPRTDTSPDSSWLPTIVLMNSASSESPTHASPPGETSAHLHEAAGGHPSTGHEGMVIDSTHTHTDFGGHADFGGHHGG